jgi:Skp family chaperone for outer membrane proteins
MRKYFLFLFISLLFANESEAQTRGTKIGYIDMEYILQNVPNYTEAQNQLEQKTQKWKQEIEVKKLEINKLKEALKSEKALLTKNLIEERETEIKFLEEETLDYQQKRFGPNGDLIVQKSVLTKPIQDQVFTAIQDIAEAKKYDFIFDKTSDLTILFAAKRFDISDRVLRVINRAEKREQLTKKQLKEEEVKEEKEDAVDQNPALASRQKALDERKIARDQAIADRKLLQEEKKKEAEAKRIQILTDRAAKKSGLLPETEKTAENANNSEKEDTKTVAAKAKQKQAEERAKILEDRKKTIEENKKAAEEKRQQILEEREAKKNAATVTNTKTTETGNNLEKEAAKTAAAEAKQKQLEEKAKVLEDRKKTIEENKKVAEEKRKQVLEEREAKKNTPVSIVTKTAKTDTSSEIEAAKNAAIEAKQKQAERAKDLENRKKAIEENKKTAEEKRKQILEEREAKKTGTISEVPKKEEVTKSVVKVDTVVETAKLTPAEAKQKQEEDKAKTLEDRKKVIEDRKKALEEKRKKVLEERDAAKKLKEDTLKTTKDNSNNN